MKTEDSPSKKLPLVWIYTVFFISGISGLIYQVIWVRQFGLIFDNTIYSAAFVSGLFVFSLGVGSYFAGDISDRSHYRNTASGLRLYSLAEVGIAILALGVALSFPFFELWGSTVVSYTTGSEGWFEISTGSRLAQYAVSAILIVPVSLLMGATLTFLMRVIIHVQPAGSQEKSRTGIRSGLLYGFNTLGAAVGCFVVDLFLIPNIGVLKSQLIAVNLNLLAAVLGYLIYRKINNQEAATYVTPPGFVESTRVVKLTSVAIFLSGFAAMGMEVLWFRNLTSAVGQYRVMFSLLLMMILVGMWFGSVLAGYITKFYRDPKALYMTSQLLFVISTLFILMHFDTTELEASAKGLSTGIGIVDLLAKTKWAMLDPIFRMVAIPSVFMGFAFPLANAIVQKDQKSVGKRTGVIYLWNSAGVLLGTLTTGFVLIPTIGIKGSVLFLMGIALSCLLPLLLIHRRPLKFRLRPAGMVFALLLLGAGFGLHQLWQVNSNYFIIKTFRILDQERRIYFEEPYLLSASEGPSESIVVLDIPKTQGHHTKFLLTNGHSMSSTSGTAQRYMRAMVHVPLLQMENPKDVLVICFGVGNTAHSASLHKSVTNIEIADLSKHVLQHGKYFADVNKNVLTHPNVSVYVNDGRMHLKMKPEKSFDLVTLEPPPIGFAGMANLYSKEFYEIAESRLKPNGVITQWLPISQLPGDAILSMIRSFVDVFPETVLLATDPENYILMGLKGSSVPVNREALQTVMAGRGPLAQDLASIGLSTVEDFHSLYRSSAAAMKTVLDSVVPITDDFPKMEYGRFAYAKTQLPQVVLGINLPAN